MRGFIHFIQGLSSTGINLGKGQQVCPIPLLAAAPVLTSSGCRHGNIPGMPGNVVTSSFPTCHPDRLKLAEGIFLLRPSGCHCVVSCSPGKSFPALLWREVRHFSMLLREPTSPPSQRNSVSFPSYSVLFCPRIVFWGLCEWTAVLCAQSYFLCCGREGEVSALPWEDDYGMLR